MQSLAEKRLTTPKFRVLFVKEMLAERVLK